MFNGLALAVMVSLLTCAGRSLKISEYSQEFEVYKSGRVFQKLHGAENSMSFRGTLAKMDLLRNRRIVGRNRTSCIMRSPEKHEVSFNSGVSNGTSNENVSFIERAESLGINHVHRKMKAARPGCVIDFIIPNLNSSRKTILNAEFCVPEHITGGAAVGDYNSDNRQDIYFTVFHSRSVLYRNNGDGTFSDVTQETEIGPLQYANGASWADIDQDGDVDLYVTTVGDTRHYLYVNDGGKFKEEALERNCSLQFPNKRKLVGMSANFGDFDGDGYPDLYVTEWILHTQGKPSASRLLRNKGASAPGYFEDVTDEYGVDMDTFDMEKHNLNSGTYSFASSFTDFDNDGLQDLLVTADFGESRMFWNRGKNKTFWECTEHCGLKGEQDAMGHAIGDWNNDGLLEWFSSAIMDDKANCKMTGCTFDDEGNRLYQNLGGRQFVDVTQQVGVQDGGWGWGTAFLDFNNDGYQDLVLTNGIDFPTTATDDHFGKQQMRLWQNMGKGFSDKAREVSSEVGMNSTREGRGLLTWDFDDDGDTDVVVCNNVGSPEIYENVGGNKQNWIKIKAMHRCKQRKEFLCDSLGARVQVTTLHNGQTQTQEIGSKTHFLAQSETSAHFGLGRGASNLIVNVTWPATQSEVCIYNVTPNVRLQIVKPRSGIKTINYSSLEVCPTLRLGEITQQPEKAVVTINPDGKTARFTRLPGYDFEEMGKQNFTYKIHLYQSDPNTSTVSSEAQVSVVFVDDISSDEDCRDGKPSVFTKITATDKRRYDGISNNKQHVLWGAAGQDLRRTTSPAYSDGIARPASVCTDEQRQNQSCAYDQEYSGFGSTRPSPREISNLLFRQTEPIISARRINDFHVHFGQFLSHDTDLTTTLPRHEFQEKLNDVWLPIRVPKGDVYFDLHEHESYLPFVRSSYNRCTGRESGTPRQQTNVLSSYIDGGMVYGSDETRNRRLRTLEKGKMKVWKNEMLPLNTAGLANTNNIGRNAELLFIAGDTRANVQPGLMAVHTVFLHEHNRLCDDYLKHHPNASDEEVFQYARTIVASELQAITFREYLPAVLGGTEDIPPYRGYNDSVDATVDHIFATAALRFGHSQVNSLIWRLDERGEPIKEGHLPLRDAYFAPERIILEGGIDPIFRGAFAQPAQAVDTKMVDDVRNFLFAVRRGEDLSSLNIQRGRDHGLPDLNTVRATIGLRKHQSFENITRDAKTATLLERIYHDINNVDLWVGGLAEDHEKGELGPTFRKIVLDSFLRIRDGDRFWYENILTSEEIQLVENLTLSEIIRRNTNIDKVPRHIFYSTLYCSDVEKENCVPHDCHSNRTPNEPGTKETCLQKTIVALENKTERLKQNLTSMEKQKKQLTEEINTLRSKHKTPSQENNGKCLLGDAAIYLVVFLIVALLIFLITTVVFVVLYFKTRRHCEKGKSRTCHTSRETVSTTFSSSKSSIESIPTVDFGVHK